MDLAWAISTAQCACSTQKGTGGAVTFSIIARDDVTGRFGIAVASKFSGVGAVVSQALMNPYSGPRGLALLAAGATAKDAVRLLTAADEGSQLRQLHVMDRAGTFAGHTGRECPDWCGHLKGDTFSVAGNTLTGADVLEAMATAYEQNVAMPLASRLILAMQAGEAAGGDSRGKQSAALLVHDREEYSLFDLRVDDHPDPLAELARLEEVARESWVHVRRVLPSADNPFGILDSKAAQDAIAASRAEGYE
jgi:uncharacterized Ntn-hydrolase superfamily protein